MNLPELTKQHPEQHLGVYIANHPTANLEAYRTLFRYAEQIR